jgi:agmatine/peptidylarginine deiminase
MPIQTDENRFVSYKYYPNYLVKKHQEQYITDVKDVENVDFLHQADVVILDLVLDGGNVVKCGNKIVMTEKVFVENKDKSRNEVQRLLEEAFQCEIVFLSWDKRERYGHSDGIIHYLGDNHVLMTNYNDFDKTFAQDFLRILEKHFDVKTLKYNVDETDKYSWALINFLQVGNLVLVPQLGILEDKQAFQQIAEALPNCKVIGVPTLEAVRKGGALNCISWNIKL